MNTKILYVEKWRRNLLFILCLVIECRYVEWSGITFPKCNKYDLYQRMINTHTHNKRHASISVN